MNRIRMMVSLLFCLGILSGCEMSPYRKSYILADQQPIKKHRIIIKGKEISSKDLKKDPSHS